jgi:flagellar biosynthesis chaperone FliJ
MNFSSGKYPLVRCSAILLLCTLIPACSRFTPKAEYMSNDANPQRLSGGGMSNNMNKAYNAIPQQAQIGGFNDALKQAQRNKQQAAKQIRNANLSVRAENARVMLDSVKRIVAALQGTISHESESVGGEDMTIQVVVRLPSEHLETAVTRFAAYATLVTSKSITIEDVGEQIVDLEARLATKREVEQRYRDLLKQAKTVQDVLAVEQQLNTLREEMESQQGRLAYLSNRVAESTINLTIQADAPPSAYRETFGKRITTAFLQSWEYFQSAIVFGISMFPVVCLIVVVCAVLWWLWRKFRSRKKAAASAEASPSI